MPTTGDDLAPEIWLAIADEVAALDRHSRGRLSSRYMAINRIFFNMYLDTVYGDVQWTKLDWAMRRQLNRLQEPVIASHVQSLRIHAWFIDYLMKRDSKPNPSSLSSRILSFFARAGQHPANRSQSKLIFTVSSKTILGQMISAIHSMKNLGEYHFELRDLKLTNDSTRFLVAARRAFSSSLRKLSVHTTIFKFKSILALSDFENLEELELYFDYQCHPVHKDDAFTASKFAEVLELRDTIIPFINRRLETLQSLTIASYSTIDLSEFFKSIGPFQSLRRLSVNICLGSKQLSDSNALVDFIHNHRNSLFELDIHPRPPEEDFVDAEDTARRRMESWVRIQQAILSHEDVARTLEGLHIPVGDLDACLSLIARSAPTLTHLTLSDRFFCMPDLKRVLNVFALNPFRLKSLFVCVQDLNVPLIQLLAGRLPGLHSLVLLFETCGICENVYQPQDLFINEMAKCAKEGRIHWDVEHISVIQIRRTISLEDAELLGVPSTGEWTEQAWMNAISAAIPSIKSHKGIHWHRQLPPRRIRKTPEPHSSYHHEKYLT